MRLMMVLTLSLSLLLSPLVAASEPVSATVTSQQAAVSTSVQAPAATQPAATAQPQTAASTQTAAAQAGPETVVVQGEKVDLDQVVCREAPPQTGSRIGAGRECHTERQWRQRMHDAQDITRRQQIMGYQH